MSTYAEQLLIYLTDLPNLRLIRRDVDNLRIAGYESVENYENAKNRQILVAVAQILQKAGLKVALTKQSPYGYLNYPNYLDIYVKNEAEIVNALLHTYPELQNINLEREVETRNAQRNAVRGINTLKEFIKCPDVQGKQYFANILDQKEIHGQNNDPVKYFEELFNKLKSPLQMFLKEAVSKLKSSELFNIYRLYGEEEKINELLERNLPASYGILYRSECAQIKDITEAMRKQIVKLYDFAHNPDGTPAKQVISYLEKYMYSQDDSQKSNKLNLKC